MFMQILEIILLIIGSATAAALLFFFLDWAIRKIDNIMKRQSKIRCLCRHEYVWDWQFEYGSCVEYHYCCRKCGKELQFRTYEDEKLKR